MGLATCRGPLFARRRSRRSHHFRMRGTRKLSKLPLRRVGNSIARDRPGRSTMKRVPVLMVIITDYTGRHDVGQWWYQRTAAGPIVDPMTNARLQTVGTQPFAPRDRALFSIST